MGCRLPAADAQLLSGAILSSNISRRDYDGRGRCGGAHRPENETDDAMRQATTRPYALRYTLPILLYVVCTHSVASLKVVRSIGRFTIDSAARRPPPACMPFMSLPTHNSLLRILRARALHAPE